MTGQKTRSRGLKYKLIVDTLRSSIRSGTLKPGDLIKSESQLCEEYSVSRGPVRQALAELERERLTYRVPGKGTFVSDQVGARSGGAGAKRVRVLIDASPGRDDNFVAREISEGLSEAVRRLNFVGRLQYEFHRFESEADFNREALLGDVDGVLVVPFTRYCVDFLEEMRNPDVPIVALFDRVRSDYVSNFYIEHERAATQVTELLLRLGHRRIALVTDSIATTSAAMTDRIAGYRVALERAGLAGEALVVGTGFDPVAVRTSVKQMVESPNRPTAILIGGGYLTVPCTGAIRAAGLDVPAELSVIAFDDTVEARLHEPPLSVVKQPLAALGERGLERLMSEFLEGAQPAVHIGMTPELVLRESYNLSPQR